MSMGTCSICNEYSNALNSKRYCSQCQRADHFAKANTVHNPSVLEAELKDEIRHYRHFLSNLAHAEAYSVCTGVGIKFNDIKSACQTLLNKFN